MTLEWKEEIERKTKENRELELEIQQLKRVDESDRELRNFNQDLAAKAMQMKIEKEMLGHELQTLKGIKMDDLTFVLIAAEVERLNRVNKKVLGNMEVWK